MSELEPRTVAAVDQGAALVSHVLDGYLAQYRALVADTGTDTAALLLLTRQVFADAQRGAKGMEGLASLAAVAVARLATSRDQAAANTAIATAVEPYEGRATTLPCGCGYNAAGVQCMIGLGCNGNHDPVVEQVEPWHGKAVETTYSRNQPRCSTCYQLGHYASACTAGRMP